MPSLEQTRHQIRNGLAEFMGEEIADSLMEMLPPYPWDEIAKRSDVEREIGLLRSEMNIRFDKADIRMDKMNARFDKTDARLDKTDARLDKMNARFDKTDARLDKMSARFGGLYIRIVLANLLMMIALCGLLLTAMKMGS